jgi:hypothetical protein
MAHVAARKAKPENAFLDYNDSVLVVGDQDGLEDVVAGDLFKARSWFADTTAIAQSGCRIDCSMAGS